jgi:hypothetical protein
LVRDRAFKQPGPTSQGLPTAATANQPSAVAEVIVQTPVKNPAPWELLHPLTVGSVVTGDWRVADFAGAVDGSCVLTLRNSASREHRIHLCRNDGQPQGMAHTAGFDLVIMNGGAGDLPTEEGLAQAVAAIGRVVESNEGNGQASLLAVMLPHEERLRRFSSVEARQLR